mmetsp:Transcript_17766/g.68927  ORF Transcript_17766/g.68927 Transcript_17766/m.68927 type:complete len:108 (+) Transcript_17766:89-412(+)
MRDCRAAVQGYAGKNPLLVNAHHHLAQRRALEDVTAVQVLKEAVAGFEAAFGVQRPHLYHAAALVALGCAMGASTEDGKKSLSGGSTNDLRMLREYWRTVAARNELS